MRRYTHEQEQELLDLYRRGVSRADLAQRFGTTPGAISTKLSYLRAKPRGQIDRRITLDTEQQIWLRQNYPHVRSEICALRQDISLRSVVRIAGKMGVHKTPQYMRESQAYAARKAKESHIRNGTYPPKGVIHPNLVKGAAYKFKPGHAPTRKKTDNQ